MRRETFIARNTVERTNKAEIRPGKQSEKAESCRETLQNEIQLKGPLRQNPTHEHIKMVGTHDKLYLGETHVIKSHVKVCSPVHVTRLFMPRKE